MPAPRTAAPVIVDLLVTGAAEVLTCAADAPDLVGRTTGGGVAVDAGVIVAVGDVSGYLGRVNVDARGGVLLPGFVDAHTHVVFGGSRVQEHTATVAGLPVPPGAAVGIMGTTTLTRTATVTELVEQAEVRVQRMLAAGTTTLESKSGYGLDPAAELRILTANRRLNTSVVPEVVSTYLGAHAIPPDVPVSTYVDAVVAQVPEVAANGLAEFCDVYCDTGYFDLDQTRRILEAGLASGLAPKLHLDAYSHTGAAELAVELGAVSVDHLNFTPERELRLLADAGIVGVYLPCLEYAVAHPRPLQARELVAAGMEIALATDICPGCWVTDMQLVIAMACRSGGLSVAQAVRAATHGAAKSLGRAQTVGSLVPGHQADLIVLDHPTYEHLGYQLGRNAVTTVIKSGHVVKEPSS
ncbi:MAG: imidazolonepropionase [Mycobacteriaceae bacterium]